MAFAIFLLIVASLLSFIIIEILKINSLHRQKEWLWRDISTGKCTHRDLQRLVDDINHVIDCSGIWGIKKVIERIRDARTEDMIDQSDKKNVENLLQKRGLL